MKSIFILCGGYEWKYEMSMKKLAKFVLNRFAKPKILDVWFAMNEEKYKKYDLSVLNEDKIVIGSSAGAKFLSSYSPNWNGEGLREGSAILPLNVIVHYGDDNYLEGNANWSDVVMAMTKSPIGLSVILKEDDIRAFDKDGIEINI